MTSLTRASLTILCDSLPKVRVIDQLCPKAHCFSVTISGCFLWISFGISSRVTRCIPLSFSLLSFFSLLLLTIFLSPSPDPASPGTEDDDADAELREFAAESYIDLLEEQNMPDILVQTMSWVVGEYAYLAKDYDMSVVLELMGELLDRNFEDDLVTKGWIISGITKLVAQTGLLPAVVRSKMEKWQASLSADLQQRCTEVLGLVRNGGLMRTVLPCDASCEDLEVSEGVLFRFPIWIVGKLVRCVIRVLNVLKMLKGWQRGSEGQTCLHAGTQTKTAIDTGHEEQACKETHRRHPWLRHMYRRIGLYPLPLNRKAR